MAMPRSVTKVNKNGIKFVSNVDRAQYTMRELVMRANYDVARLLMRRMKDKARQSPSMKRLPKNRFNNLFQYWVRKRDCDLWVGIKDGTWYGTDAELGTKNQPRRGILRDTVYENIDDIRRIQGKYISQIENDNIASGLADEITGSGADV